MKTTPATRCNWATTDDELMIAYHDSEWGKPNHNSQHLFEMLSLELMQAGLSWKTILHRRSGFQAAFANFDYHQVSKMEEQIPSLLENPAIIRNRRKIAAIINNAQVLVNLEHQGSSFNEYLWNFVANEPIVNSVATAADVPSSTELAQKISKKMKQDGFKFAGPVVVYSLLQACGMVNDHLNDCIAK